MEKLLSIPELLKKSAAMYGRRWWPMLLLGLISWAVSLVFLGVFGLAGFATLAFVRDISDLSLVGVLLALVGSLLVIAVTLWMQASMVYMVREDFAKEDIWKMLKMVWGKMGPYYWVAFLRGLWALGGFILFVVPGIIFSIQLAFSQYALVVEGRRGAAALLRSRELVKGYWWPVFGRLALLALLSILVSSISRLGFLINSLFVMPFGVVYLSIIFEDLKTIKGAAKQAS